MRFIEPTPMGPFDLIRHPVIFLSITFNNFMHWYIVQMPGRIIKRYWEYFQAFCEIFSFWFLIKTLFSPWKQIVDTSKKRGFNLAEFGQRLTLNTTTRIIGFLFRSTAFAFGMLCQALLFLGFFTYFVLWMTFPVLFLFGISYLAVSFTI